MRRALIAALGVAIALLALPAAATPIFDDENKGVIKWPDGSTITVYIPADPDHVPDDPTKPDRADDLKAGILAWNEQQPLKDRNITIKVATGAPPADATNAVTLNWSSDKLEVPDAGSPGGKKEVFGVAGPGYEQGDMNTANGGEITVSRNTTHVDEQMAKNLGTHEMGHVLGLDDVATAGAAMNPNFTKSSTVTIAAADTKELNAVYAAADAGAEFNAVVTKLLGGYLYVYVAEWLEGASLALLQIDIGGAEITDIVAPEGWEWFLGDLPDGDGLRFPTPGLPPQDFITFRIADDGFYLGPDNDTLLFGFESRYAPVAGEAFLNGRLATIGPADIAEPATAGLLLAGLAALARRLRRSAARGARPATTR